MNKLKGYIASHFFDRGGYIQTEELANYLIEKYPDIEWYVPQRNSGINDKTQDDTNITDVKVYEADIQDQLLKADILVACCDGVEIDSGVAGEILSKATQNELEEYTSDSGLIVGYTTDMRRNKTPRYFLDDINILMEDNESIKAIEKMEIHKENFLYRNIMITGAVNKWGSMIMCDSTTDNYLSEISDIIDAWLKKSGD